MIRELGYDAHVHTALGQGLDPPELCLGAAEAAGLTCLAFTDHYGREDPGIAERLEHYRRAAGRSPVRVVAGAEAEILDATGRLTLSEATAKDLPLVLARLSERTVGVAVEVPVRMATLVENLRGALLGACRQPHVKVLALPFNLGRFPAALSPGQLPAELLEEVGAVLREEEVACEIANDIWSWFPELPLTDFLEDYATLLRAFSREGVKFVAGSNARSAGAVGNLRFAARLAAAAGIERSQFVDLGRLPALS